MQYLILIATVWTLSAKYLINCIDMRSEAPWEEKSIYVFYVELAAGQSTSLSSHYRLFSQLIEYPGFRKNRLFQALHLLDLFRPDPHLLWPPAQHPPRRLPHPPLLHPQSARPAPVPPSDPQHGRAVPGRESRRDGCDGRQDVHHLSRGHGVATACGGGWAGWARGGGSYGWSVSERGDRYGRSAAATPTGGACDFRTSDRPERHPEEAPLRPRVPLPLPPKLARKAAKLPDLVREAQFLPARSLADPS